MDLWLASDRLGSVRETPAYEPLVGTIVEPGRSDDSRLLELVSRRGGSLHMPPLGTEEVDSEGVELLRAWVSGL